MPGEPMAAQGGEEPGGRLFYILSFKHTRKGQRLATWWRPNNAGYCWDLNQVGRYSEERVRGDLFYYNSGCGTVAIPCDVVDATARAHTFEHDCETRTFHGVRNHKATLRRLIRAAPFPFDRPECAAEGWRGLLPATSPTPNSAVKEDTAHAG